jgi:hypothetical protein
MPQAYPSALPLPLIRGFRYQDQSPWIENDVALGPPRRELFTKDNPRLFQAVWVLKPDQFQLFEGWVIHTLNRGIEEFTIQLQDSQGLQTRNCLMLETHQVSYIGKIVRVSVPLRADPVDPDVCLYEDLQFLFDEFCGRGPACFIQQVDETTNQLLPVTWGNLKYGTDYS